MAANKNKSKKQLLITNRVTTTNCETGEIIDEVETSKEQLIEREPNYIKLYTDDIGRIFNLPGCSSDVLAAIASHMSYKTNLIVLYGPIKQVLMDELGMNANTFNKAVDNLYKAGMLIRVSKACYLVDPELYGSGSWNNVKQVRLSIEYSADGTKKVKTSLVKQLKNKAELELEEFEKQIKTQKKLKAPKTPANQLAMSFEEQEAKE